jgi:hypothetical protein
LELVPTFVEDGPVQPGLLLDVAAGLGDGASCRAGHVADAQVFDHDQRVTGSQLVGGLGAEVATPVNLAALDSAHRRDGLLPVR